MARAVFLGTPRFAAPALRALAREHELTLVVTQPDRAGGRGRHQLYVPAVKQVAEELGLRVLQPRSLRRDREALQALREARADVFVLAAFGQILRPEVLAIPRRGCVGIHASLLPRYRGAAPIAAAILQGEEETGVTLMLTDAGMDTGPIIAQQRLPIAEDDTTETLGDRLADLGAELLSATLPAWLAGEIVPRPQHEAEATCAPPLEKAQGLIDWQRSALQLARQVRAFSPWPGAFTSCRSVPLKVLRARPIPFWPRADAPGTVVEAHEAIGVVTGEGLLVLEVVQLAGKKPLEARVFARGQHGFVGNVLGS